MVLLQCRKAAWPIQDGNAHESIALVPNRHGIEVRHPKIHGHLKKFMKPIKNHEDHTALPNIRPQSDFFPPNLPMNPNSVRSLADGLSIWNSRCTEDHISTRLRGSELQGCCQGLKVQTQQPAKAGRFVIREELWEDGRWFVCFFCGFGVYIYIHIYIFIYNI
jgi:hypothetical protein